MKYLLLFLLYFSFMSFSSQAQPDSTRLKIFYDCDYCDVTFIKQNLGLVEFVRDRKYSDVHILITTQRNGSGGDLYTLQFMGQNKFHNLSDTLSYSTNPSMTSDDRRKKQLKYIEFGLMRYFLEMEIYDKINLTYVESELGENNDDVDDPWNYWVFRVGANGWFNGQQSSSNSNIGANLSGRRVTDKNKFNLWANVNQNRSSVKLLDSAGTVLKSFQQNMNLYMSDVVTINKNWSAGIFTDVKNSIYKNYNISTGLRAGIEYNIFPYSESASKQALVYYTVGPRLNDYIDTTVYNKKNEILFEHSLLVGTSITQKWGNLRGSIKYQNYLHDFNLNSIDFDLNFDIRLFKGLSWNTNGRYSILHNQINLIKPVNISAEEAIFQQKQQESGFDYWFSTGVNYSFGSIYNTIVNPRFDF